MLTFFAYAADILMILASAGAAIYCLILSRRLSRLTSFDKGIGGAIAVLSAQVDDMQTALAQAKAGSEGAGRHLKDLVHQAKDISGELELMIAACHDFADEALSVQDGSWSDAGEPDPAAVADADDDAAPASRSMPAEPETAPQVASPVFGSRRSTSLDPVFRHRGAAGG